MIWRGLTLEFSGGVAVRFNELLAKRGDQGSAHAQPVTRQPLAIFLSVSVTTEFVDVTGLPCIFRV